MFKPIVTKTLNYHGVAIEVMDVEGRAAYVVRREDGVFPYDFDTLAGAQEFIDGWKACQDLYLTTPLGNLVAAPANGS